MTDYHLVYVVYCWDLRHGLSRHRPALGAEPQDEECWTVAQWLSHAGSASPVLARHWVQALGNELSMRWWWWAEGMDRTCACGPLDTAQWESGRTRVDFLKNEGRSEVSV